MGGAEHPKEHLEQILLKWSPNLLKSNFQPIVKYTDFQDDTPSSTTLKLMHFQ